MLYFEEKRNFLLTLDENFAKTVLIISGKDVFEGSRNDSRKRRCTSCRANLFYCAFFRKKKKKETAELGKEKPGRPGKPGGKSNIWFSEVSAGPTINLAMKETRTLVSEVNLCWSFMSSASIVCICHSPLAGKPDNWHFLPFSPETEQESFRTFLVSQTRKQQVRWFRRKLKN